MKPFYLFLFSYVVLAEDIRTTKYLHDGNNQFTARMFSEILQLNPHKSVVLSAFSVLTPLSQLAVASEGPSHDELLNAVGFPDDATINKVFALVDEKFNSIEGIELKKASKLYIPLGYQVQHEFATLSRDVYHSEIANINFSHSQKSADEINAWVEDQTNHRIKDLVDASSITSDTRGILVNALYFRGAWEYPFSKYATVDREFKVNKQQSQQVQMMHQTEVYRYKDSKVLKSKILELPYQGNKSSFVIVLPNEVEGLAQLIEKLKDPSILDKETSHMSYVEVKARIPKFRIETTTDLKDVLIKMNVTKIFGAEANLSKLLKTDETLYISDAKQKAFIEINEVGSEAAASNAFGIMLTSLIIRPSFDFVADHPFAYYLKIQDEIVFSGVYYGP